MKKYMDIERLKDKYISAFIEGEHITITEKIDGANASIRYNPETDEVQCFSRRNELSPSLTLEGFWNYVQTLDKDIIKAATDNGRYIIFGEWLCLSGDTIIKKASSGKDKSTMTLKELYEHKFDQRSKEYCKRGINKLLHLLIKGESVTKDNYKQYKLSKYETIDASIKKGYIKLIDNEYKITDSGIKHIEEYYIKNSRWTHDGYPSIFSFDLIDYKIKKNRILDIVYTGKKKVFKVTTKKGYSIKSTKEHRFLTPKGWECLESLKPFDCVAITDFSRRRIGGRSFGKGTRGIKRQMDEFKNSIKQCEICGKEAPSILHHIDGNPQNNDISNWKMLCSQCHRDVHNGISTNMKYDYEFDYIVNIEELPDMEDCYDIAMCGDENVANFVANNFIVHNCKHSIKYPEDKMKHFYMFDLYDTEKEEYTKWEQVKKVAEFVGLTTVPIFYDGKFTTWDDVYSYLGKSEMCGEPSGEGIVVKSQDRLDNKNSRTPCYVKIVTKEFSEVHKSKPHKEIDPEKVAQEQRMLELVATVVTPRRVEKTIQKFIEDELIPRDWDEHDLADLSKILPKAVCQDCVKEEKETVIKVEKFGKYCAKLCMQYARDMIK